MIFSSNTMNLNIKNDVPFLTFKKLEKFKFIKHSLSTRLGGLSQGPFSSMNLGLNTEDNSETIRNNYAKYCKSLDINPESLAFLNQTHGNNIKIINKKDLKNQDQNDGSITNVVGITLTTTHADCCAIYVVDPINKAIGLAHAGWKGTIKNIGTNLINEMKENFNSDPKTLTCCISPSIGKCCFEVGLDVYKKFENSDINSVFIKDNKFYVDIKNHNKQKLINSGVLEDNIIISDLCTKCNNELFYSHRAQGKRRGCMIATLSIIQQ